MATDNQALCRCGHIRGSHAVWGTKGRGKCAEPDCDCPRFRTNPVPPLDPDKWQTLQGQLADLERRDPAVAAAAQRHDTALDRMCSRAELAEYRRAQLAKAVYRRLHERHPDLTVEEIENAITEGWDE